MVPLYTYALMSQRHACDLFFWTRSAAHGPLGLNVEVHNDRSVKVAGKEQYSRAAWSTSGCSRGDEGPKYKVRALVSWGNGRDEDDDSY